jgi:hypothetical protein
MIRRWGWNEDKILQPLCQGAGSETELGRDGVFMLRGEGYHRTECSVRHRMRWLRKQAEWNKRYAEFARVNGK